jgi:hypothetical protein
MKSQFNVGDKVKVVRGEGSDLNNGDVCTVVADDVCSHTARVHVKDSQGVLHYNGNLGYNDTRFELVDTSSPEKPAIDFTKPVVNGYGKLVTILSMSAAGSYPIVGQPEGGGVNTYTQEGNYYVDEVGYEDLQQALEPKKEVVRYFNVYASGAMPCHSTRADADANATSDRIACKKVVFTEGDFDE